VPWRERNVIGWLFSPRFQPKEMVAIGFLHYTHLIF
jgi:hypothetical protein